MAAWLAVTATYFYFLIFAEFAFLELATKVTANPTALEPLMLALGLGGIGGAALGAVLANRVQLRSLLAWMFRACAVGAVSALIARGPGTMAAAALVVGLSLGGLTVVLAAVLRAAAGNGQLGLCIGAGTGLAYALCNLPVVFHAGPVAQTVIAAMVAVAGSVLPAWMSETETVAVAEGERSRSAVLRWLAILLALVWMDSAAFYIVQHTPALRAANWGDSVALYTNAIVHFVFAVVAGWALDRRRRGWMAGLSILALAGACLILNETVKLPTPAGWFYTAGVSFYSVILVEFPARDRRPWVAALIFGVAGWIGSALGIGMAQDLARVPMSFVIGASLVVVTALIWRARALRLAVMVGVAMVVVPFGGRADDGAAWVARGREVYIAEGCIHCHSQYVRPRDTTEVERWGPTRPLIATLAAAPPLIGTRRQGPDLANVGNRRSPEWNRLHLLSPRSVSPGSRMPRYAHLFAEADGDGHALLAYLASLGAETFADRLAQIAQWRPDVRAVASPEHARRVFGKLCIGCHGVTGRGDGPLVRQLTVRPPDWSQVPFCHIAANESAEIALSRIIKFGVWGTVMAGHEYLPDSEVVSLARFVQELHAGGDAASFPSQQ
jgi:mono/diheme cytochrome c family protein